LEEREEIVQILFHFVSTNVISSCHVANISAKRAAILTLVKSVGLQFKKSADVERIIKLSSAIKSITLMRSKKKFLRMKKANRIRTKDHLSVIESVTT
jgi:hypothetical protein